MSEVIKAECSQCEGIRNCDIKGRHTKSYNEDHFQAWTTWHILECRGCEHVFIQTFSANSEDYHHYYEEDGSFGNAYNETVTYWPALSKRKMPDWIMEEGFNVEILEPLHKALLELHGALNNDLKMLAAIGIRTSFDIASELLGINPDQSFQNKLKELVYRSLIGGLDKDRLEILVEAGNASVHRGRLPEANELKIMMDVLEHFVHEAFVVPSRIKLLDIDAAKVKAVVPTRKPKMKKVPASKKLEDLQNCK